MKITLTSQADAAALSEFYMANAEHLNKWEPLRPNDYHTMSAWQQRLIGWEQEHAEGRSAHFASYNNRGEIVAVCNLSNIVFGPFQACNMGYAVARCYQGQGVMAALCEHVIVYAFEQLKLNRVMANYMPENKRSAVLLKRLGFSEEGRARKYLKINGQWQDHILTSLINPKNI